MQTGRAGHKGTAWAIQWHMVVMFLPSLVSGLIIERIGISRGGFCGVGSPRALVHELFCVVIVFRLGLEFLVCGFELSCGSLFFWRREVSCSGFE